MADSVPPFPYFEPCPRKSEAEIDAIQAKMDLPPGVLDVYKKAEDMLRQIHTYLDDNKSILQINVKGYPLVLVSLVAVLALDDKEKVSLSQVRFCSGLQQMAFVQELIRDLTPKMKYMILAEMLHEDVLRAAVKTGDTDGLESEKNEGEDKSGDSPLGLPQFPGPGFHPTSQPPQPGKES